MSDRNWKFVVAAIAVVLIVAGFYGLQLLAWHGIDPVR